MRSARTFSIASFLLGSAVILTAGFAQQRQAKPPEKLPREYTVSAIPGVIAAGAKWELVWQGNENGDGFVGTPDGGIIFAQEQSSTVRKVDKDGYDSALVKDTHGAGALAMDSRGRIYAVQRTCTDPGRANIPCTETTKVSIIYPEKERKVLADSADGKPFGRLSDLVVGKNGMVYFTGSIAYYIKKDGKVATLDNIRANGIMLSPDEKTLYVTNGPGIVAFDVKPDGTVDNRRDWAKLDNWNADGLAVDTAGRLYITGGPGIQVWSADAKHLGTIPAPRDTTTLCFSGPDRKAVYIMTGGMLAVNGTEFRTATDIRNNAKTMYKIQMMAEGYKGRPK